MAGNLIRNAETIQEILARACERRELLILVTPYLRFETSFLRLEGQEIHILATMGREDATYGLRNADLRMRFPHGVSFLEAGTQLRGFGIVDGRRTLRLAVPESMQEEDHRGSYRVERVGRVPVTFSTPKYDLAVGTLVDISTTGARIYSTRDFAEEELQPGSAMAVTIPLTDGIRINSPVKLRHRHGRTFGVEFVPQLDEDVLQPLSRWVFERREEDRDRASRRGVEAATPLEGIRNVSILPRGLVLISGDPALETTLQDLLGGLQPLHRVPPTAQALKEAFAQNPALVFFHLPSLGLDERRRLKPMAELLQGRVPFILLGTGIEGGPLLELGTELKAAVAIVFNPARGVFFQRLVQGVLRRTYEGGESPMAPKEPEGA
ncbi:MAG TPA: PilZ domain-containing protein [Holophagaceae bacterium]